MSISSKLYNIGFDITKFHFLIAAHAMEFINHFSFLANKITEKQNDENNLRQQQSIDLFSIIIASKIKKAKQNNAEFKQLETKFSTLTPVTMH